MTGNSEKNTKKKKSRRLIICLCILIAIIVMLLNFRSCENPAGSPTLTIQTPQKISISQTEEVVLDVSINCLGEALYPAMSMSIDFDSSRLEFMGIEEGNVFIHNDTNTTGLTLPDWSCNVDKSNETGVINIMYLDMTGGKYAFSKELLEKDDNALLRLRFRLRGSVRAGDVMDISFRDAVFAASDETLSLAMTKDTLNTRNGKIVTGE